MRIHITLAFVITAILIGGCASDYSPRADLSTVQNIGLVVPPGASEPQGAENVMQLYNLTVGEDRLKNSAVGAGAGAAVGTAVGIGAAALTGCALTGPWAPACWVVFGGGGAILGGGTGAIAGATVDTQERVQTAPLHLYEVDRVLPDLKRDYLAEEVLQDRALHIARKQETDINFVPAAWNDKRYAPTESMVPITDINIVLTVMNVSLSGKAKEDPNVILNVDMQWSLTKYIPETQSDEVWDVMRSSYESKRHRLSEWLAEDGALLQTEVDRGIEHSLTNSFSGLPGMIQ